MGGHQPFMYDAEHRNSSRFPETTFDPKAATRASWEPKPRKPRPDGPLLSFNRHPDAHMVLSYRSNEFSSMNPRTKAWITGMRWAQLVLRLFHVVAAAGLLVLWILFDKVGNMTAWVMRITFGVVIVHGCYAVYHLARNAAGRTPGSSAAYSVFAAVTDLATLVIYAFGAFTVHQNSATWTIRLNDKALLDVFVPVVYYGLIGAGGLHLFSFAISLFLGVVFRRISLMPPDMNPLESHLTARPKHKKSKSSISTSTSTADEKRLSTPLEMHRRSGLPYEDVSRPPSVPFMHTRTQSRDSMVSRESRSDLANFRYDHVYGQSPGSSVVSTESKRKSAPPGRSHRGSYTELPLHDGGSPLREDNTRNSGQSRPAKFTETWAPTDSMISRTNQRNRYEALNKSRAQMRGNKSYSALSQRYSVEDSSDSEYDDENQASMHDNEGRHPNPLRLNPSASEISSINISPKKSKPRMQTPFRPQAEDNPLAPMSSNSRRVSASRDIADQSTTPGSPWQRSTGDLLQPEDQWFSRPYGELKSATPPVMIGSDRKVSSGNDYDPKHHSAVYERRNVSGKIAEEGRAGKRASHMGFFRNR